MIAILGQTEDDILYYCSRFTNGETIDELPFGVKVHKGNFGMDEIVIAATGYGNIRTALVTNMLIDKYDPYRVIYKYFNPGCYGLPKNITEDFIK